MTSRSKSVLGAVRMDCARCGLPTLSQRAGALPFPIVADAAPLTLDAALALRTADRLAWCLRESKWSGARLAEISVSVHAGCERPHVVCHVCRVPAGRGGTR